MVAYVYQVYSDVLVHIHAALDLDQQAQNSVIFSPPVDLNLGDLF